MSKEDLGTIKIQIDIDEDAGIVITHTIDVKNVSSSAFLAVILETIVDIVADQNVDIRLVEKMFKVAIDRIDEKQKENKYAQYDA